MAPNRSGTLLLVTLLLLVAAPVRAGNVDVFAIDLEEIVSDGMPGPGAGNIESPGATDQYTFTVDPGTLVYVDELDGLCVIRWRLEDAAGTELFSDIAMCSSDPGRFTLAGGMYTITVFGVGDATGAYSFTIWEVNPAETFVISLKDVVAEDAPEAGAGNIEEPGAIDVYEIDLAAGSELYFDELGGPCGVGWCMEAPDGSEVFCNPFFCSSDPGLFTAEQSGTYTITVSGNADGTGTYSFTIWAVNSVETFTIGLEEIVSDGVPGAGAGNIEEPGAVDEYTLTLPPQTLVCFQELGGGCAIAWQAEDPNGVEVFHDANMCATNAGRFLLETGGDYTITVFGNGDATGTYSFVVIPGRAADLDGDCAVGFTDLSLLLGSWGTPDGDVDGDGATGFVDLVALLGDWG